MKIFPLRPLSVYDRMRSLCNIIAEQAKNKTNKLESDAVIFNDNKPLKKGRNICDMLSE